MPIEIFAVGGYGEVGRNMTAVQVDDEIVIFDMGLHLPNYIRFTEGEREDVVKLSADSLRRAQAVPDDRFIGKLKGKVVAIVPTHAHLDHIGAIPYLAEKYDAPVICTPFTAAVINSILRDEKIKIPNKIMVLNPNSSTKLSKKMTLDFINVTHSTPQTIIALLKTKHGNVIYANDFKFDDHPLIGKKPNYEALREAGKEGVVAAIVDSLYAYDDRKTPCEGVAREMLRDVMLGVDNRKKAVIVTTFSSHIARLNSIVEFGKQLGRKIVFLGRSLSKYAFAAEDSQVAFFSKDADITKFRKEAMKKLSDVMKKGKDKYLLVVTGHQGEPQATLSRMASGKTAFEFSSEDHVIFSSSTIPTSINQEQRKRLVDDLKGLGARVFTDIHVSGHAGREDLRDFINMVKAEHLIPAHSEKRGIDAFVQLAEEMGYEAGKTVVGLRSGQSLVL